MLAAYSPSAPLLTASYGFNDFIILTGYKSHVIKDYFVHYYTFPFTPSEL